MTNLLSPVAKAKFFANNGKPAAGFKVFSYAAGTTTKLATYPNESDAVPNANPVVLDFRGEADIWIPPNVAYKFVFTGPNDTDPPTAPIWTVDDIVDSQLVTLWGGVDTGIANAYVLNFVANFTSYTDGIVIYWIPSNSNTGPSTINVNGLGPVAITNQDGTPLYLGQLQANQVALIIYRGTGFTLVATSLVPTINTQNADYTFGLGDAGNIVMHDDANPYSYTVPLNATAAFPLGASIDIINISSQQLNVIPAVGAILVAFGSTTSGGFLMEPNTCTRITKVATNTWIQFNQSDLVFQQGTFTGSISGMTAALNITVTYFRTGSVIALKMPSAGTITGTSNTTAMQMSGLPAILRPKNVGKTVLCYGIVDNGVISSGLATVDTAGNIAFAYGIPPAAFTAAGTKGFNNQWNMMYPL